jgi:hypothetical protein
MKENLKKSISMYEEVWIICFAIVENSSLTVQLDVRSEGSRSSIMAQE